MLTRPYARPSGAVAGASASLGFERRRLVIVDAHGHAFRAFWALEPMYAPDGLPTNALYGLAGLLRRLVFEERPDYLAVVFDAPDDARRTFRSALFPAYKAHRPERPPELARQIPVLREVTRALGLETLEHPDYEADDLVATLVRQAEAADVHTTILSADKDLLQLVSARTLVWDAMRGKRYTPAAVEDKLGVPPHLVADYLALVGDTSDNVPGVPGIGPKSASALLRTFGSLDAIYEAIDRVQPRERKKLDAHRERAVLSRALTRLCSEVPLGCDLEGLRLPSEPPGAALGASLWERLGFSSLLPTEWSARTRREVRPDAVHEVVVEAAAASLAVDRQRGDDEHDEDGGEGPGASEVVGPSAIEICDLDGLRSALDEARRVYSLGLAMVGEPPPRVTTTARSRKRQPAAPLPRYEPPVVGLALPSGACWRIVVRGADPTRPGRPGDPIQGSLFEPPAAEVAAAGVALADVMAALGSLAADARRVLCVCDAERLGATLNLGHARIVRALDSAATAQAAPRDPALAAQEALFAWLGGTGAIAERA